MTLIFQGINLISRYTDIWNIPRVSNLCNFLIKNHIYRIDFLRKYSSVLSEKLETGKIIDEDYPKNLFVDPKDANIYNEQKFQKIRSELRSFYGKLFINTKLLGYIITNNNNYNFLEESDPLLFCKKCPNFVSGGIVCSCGNKNLQKIKLLKFPKIVMEIWDSNPGHFLEGITYASIKKLTNIKKIDAGVEFQKKGEKPTTLTEADVLVYFDHDILNKNNMKCLAIQCGTNPRLSSEKNQIDFLYSRSIPSIFVTTEKDVPVTIKDKAEKVFTSVAKDKRFPENLVDYIKNI